jgi:hypothetical protein
MVNIEFFWDGGPWGMDDIPIVGVFRDEWMIPAVGQEVRIKGKIVRITRQSPNPSVSGQKTTYFVQNINGNKPYKDRK